MTSPNWDDERITDPLRLAGRCLSQNGETIHGADIWAFDRAANPATGKSLLQELMVTRRALERVCDCDLETLLNEARKEAQ